MDNIIQVITVAAIPLIFAITVHEVMHGYVALRFGDTTAFRAGRLSLNPLNHIDPLGTVLLPLGMLALNIISGAGFVIFGWAKPVPVNFGALNNPKRDMFWVAVAGPMSNLIMALLWKVVLILSYKTDWGTATLFLTQTANLGVDINIVFAAINLLPILPLDGGRMLASLLPRSLSEQYSRLEPYGFLIVIGLILTGIAFTLISPLIYAFKVMINFLVS